MRLAIPDVGAVILTKEYRIDQDSLSRDLITKVQLREHELQTFHVVLLAPGYLHAHTSKRNLEGFRGPPNTATQPV